MAIPSDSDCNLKVRFKLQPLQSNAVTIAIAASLKNFGCQKRFPVRNFQAKSYRLNVSKSEETVKPRPALNKSIKSTNLILKSFFREFIGSPDTGRNEPWLQTGSIAHLPESRLLETPDDSNC